MLVLDAQKYWLKFIMSGKAEDYLKYVDAVKGRTERTAEEDSLFNGRTGDKGKQYRG